jgi:hypothetical protein
LKPHDKVVAMKAVRKLNAAYEEHVASGSADHAKWPASLRIRALQSARGVWEMTWSFAGQDGRATFEFIDIDGELAIRWRRIGGHEIFTSP